MESLTVVTRIAWSVFPAVDLLVLPVELSLKSPVTGQHAVCDYPASPSVDCVITCTFYCPVLYPPA